MQFLDKVSMIYQIMKKDKTHFILAKEHSFYDGQRWPGREMGAIDGGWENGGLGGELPTLKYLYRFF